MYSLRGVCGCCGVVVLEPVDRKAAERQSIQICRVLCIFFMMSVHIPPGSTAASLFNSGALAPIGTIWIDWLGRASVASLSFISGYLYVRTIGDASFAEAAARKFRTLLVPMLFWNLVFCALLLVKGALGGGTARLAEPGVGWVALLTGLTGPTANRSLFFLRDLFASGLILYCLRPALRRWPIPLIGLLVVLAVFELTAPIVFRPAILLFLCAGAAVAWRVGTLSDLTRLAFLLPVVVASVGLLLLSPLLGGSAAAGEVIDLARRAILTAVVLWLATRLVGTTAATWIVPWERRVFEGYLVHAALFGVVWAAWSRLIGGPLDPSYLGFFLAAPVAAMLAGRALGAAADHLPPALQIMLRGKAAPSPARAGRTPTLWAFKRSAPAPGTLRDRSRFRRSGAPSPQCQFEPRPRVELHAPGPAKTRWSKTKK